MGGDVGGTNDLGSSGNPGSATQGHPGSVSNTNDLGSSANTGKVGTGNRGNVGGSNDMGSNMNPGDAGSRPTGNVGGANDFGSTGNAGNVGSHTGSGVGGTNDMGSKANPGGDTSQGVGQGGVAGTNDMGSAGNDGELLFTLALQHVSSSGNGRTLLLYSISGTYSIFLCNICAQLHTIIAGTACFTEKWSKACNDGVQLCTSVAQIAQSRCFTVACCLVSI